MVDVGNLRIDTGRALEVGRAVIVWAGRLTKSAGNLAGAASIIAVGGWIGYEALGLVRLPDSVLLAKAIEGARALAAARSAPSAIHQRDGYLILLAAASALCLAGIGWLVAWLKNPLGKEKAVTSSK
jgi:hypothetical protein